MAKAIYEGIDGVARKIKNVYEGISNVACKVKNGYIGVSSVARLCFQNSIITNITYDSGLTVTYESSYYGTGIYVYTESSSTKHVYIYGDFAGKTITGKGRRDTKARGSICLINSSGSVLASKSLNDDPTVNDPNFSFGPYSDAVALEISALNKGADCVAIYELNVDGENILNDIQALLN